MSNIVERLRYHPTDDHEKGCDGRGYACQCGYDAQTIDLLREAAAEIERLRTALRPMIEHFNVGGGKVPIGKMLENARRALDDIGSTQSPG